MSEERPANARVETVAALDQLLDLHPVRDAEIAIDCRETFLRKRAGAPPARRRVVRASEREAMRDRLRVLRQSFWDVAPGSIEAEVGELDLERLPDLDAALTRLRTDEALRPVYEAVREDARLPEFLRELIVANVVLDARSRRRSVAELLTAVEPGQQSGVTARTRRQLRAGARRILRRHPELQPVHGWWLQDLARLPGWNPLRSILNFLRVLVVNYVAFLAVMGAFLALFLCGALGHRLFLWLLLRWGSGES